MEHLGTGKHEEVTAKPWHYAIQRETFGPVEATELKRLWDDKKIHENTLVWQKSSKDGWNKIKRQQNLKAFLNASVMGVLGDPDMEHKPPPPPPPLPQNPEEINEKLPVAVTASEEMRQIRAKSLHQAQEGERKRLGSAKPDLEEDGDRNWYYVNNEETSVGPICLRELKMAFADSSGELTRDTLIWHAVMHENQDWTKARDLPRVWAYITKAKETKSAAISPDPDPPRHEPPPRPERKILNSIGHELAPELPPQLRGGSSVGSLSSRGASPIASPSASSRPLRTREKKPRPFIRTAPSNARSGSPELAQSQTSTHVGPSDHSVVSPGSPASWRRRVKKRHQLTLNGTFEMERKMAGQKMHSLAHSDTAHKGRGIGIKDRWYYVDTKQRRMGPVDADRLRELWKTSEDLDDYCVIWNMDDDDFPAWVRIKDAPTTYKQLFVGPCYREPHKQTWHYIDQNESQGPITISELRQKYWQSKLSRDDLVWDSAGTTSENWVRLETIAPFASRFRKPKPLPNVPLPDSNGNVSPIDNRPWLRTPLSHTPSEGI